MQRLAQGLLLAQLLQVAHGSTDVVVAHHDEDLAWLASVAPPAGAEKPRVIVYTKGEEQVRLPDGMKLAGEVRTLANVGRESHAYLSHIVENYDSLADWTVFTQAAAPSFGYRGHRSGGGHLLAGDSFEDYLTPTESGSRFIYTSVVEIPSLHHVMRVSYCINDTRVESGLARHEAQACPADESAWTEWWEVGWLNSYLSSKVEAQGGEMPLDFFREYIDPEHKERDSVLITFAQGARFALSRETIHRRPKADYQRILSTLALDEDPYSGYYMEWMWGELFLGHTEPCTLPARLPAGVTPTSHQNAMDKLAYRYYKGHNGQLLPNTQTPSVVPAQFRRRMQSGGDGLVSGVSGISGISGIAVSGVSIPEEAPAPSEPEEEPTVSTPTVSTPVVTTPVSVPVSTPETTEHSVEVTFSVAEDPSEITTQQLNEIEAGAVDAMEAEMQASDPTAEITGTEITVEAGSSIITIKMYTNSAAAATLAASAAGTLDVAALLEAIDLAYIEGSLSVCVGDCTANVVGGGGLSDGAIAGICVGTIVGALLIGGAAAFFVMQQKKKQKQVGVY